MIVSGKISVKAILQNRKRAIKKLYIMDGKKDKESRYVEGIAKGIAIERLSREAMDALAQNTTHGGYLVDCDVRQSDTIETLGSKKVLSLMCIEGVSDPYNLGEIMRTIASLGFDGVITSNYSFYDNEAKLIRASAGASESIHWVTSDDIAQTLASLKANGVEIVAAYRGDESVSLHNYHMPLKVCICLGGALRGLSRSVLDQADVDVRIDYDARVSLSTLGAAGVFAYERFRQKEIQS